LAAALTTCAGHSPVSPTLGVAGQWNGTIESPVDGPGTIALQLTQSGLDVAGSFRLSQDGISDVPGTLTRTLASAPSPTTMLRPRLFRHYARREG
jgi:hypothetical protein